MAQITSLNLLDVERFESPEILKKLALSSRRLAELKGIAGSIPNQSILINTLGLQEAKDSSEIENIITTHDELFKDEGVQESIKPRITELLDKDALDKNKGDVLPENYFENIINQAQ